MALVSSSSPDGKSGDYTFKLFFYDEVDKESAKKDYSMTNDEMLEKFRKLVDLLEVIGRVEYYTHPLNVIQLSKYNLHHAYIVFKTDKWWWSIEKNDTCVAIQRSKSKEIVSHHFYRKKRLTGMTGISCGQTELRSGCEVRDLLKHIQARNYVNEKYHFIDQNCQKFANNIYTFLTDSAENNLFWPY